MYEPADIRHVLKALCDSSLVISPWLAYVGGKVRFDSYISDLFYWEARNFANANWRREYAARAFGNLPLPSRFPRTAIYDTAASTAVYLAYEQTGTPVVTDRQAQDALHFTEDFVLKHGFDYFVSAYTFITTYENHTALDYYGKMREADFLSGRFHRPWIDYSLDDELILACERGTMELFVEANERYVRLTDNGKQRLQAFSELMKDTGYLRKRSQSLRISHFSELTDYETVVSQITPGVFQLRRDLIAQSGIRPGMRVLELGCGSGPLTFDAGLADLVGSTGEIIATDPAHKMLTRAIAKRDALNKPWVEFVQSKGEDLPFADASFDAVIAFACLHLTDIPSACAEVRRVLKPGGQFTTLHPLRFPTQNPIVAKWFEPIGKLVQRPAEESFLPNSETIPNALSPYFSSIQTNEFATQHIYNNPDHVVRLFVESVGLFDEQLGTIPWSERSRVIEELKRNGEQICARYSREELTINYPTQIILAR